MTNKKYNFGIIFIITLVVIAIFLWSIAPSNTPRFDGAIGTLRNIGQLLGIMGMVLFAVSLILSARFTFLENIFYGLDKVYLEHGRIGQISFMMLLFHPLFVLGIYTDFNFKDSVLFFVPSQNWALNWGIFSLSLLLILLALTLYIRPKYNIWKWTHKFMGLAFFFGIIHTYIVSSDVHVFLPLRVYVLLLSGIALYAYLFHTVFGFYTTRKYKYVVSKINLLSRDITEIFLKPQNKKMLFVPGQYAFVSFTSKQIKKESHPFTISSSPEEEEIVFSVKNLGDYTKNIKNLRSGDCVFLEGPFGKFSYKESIYKKQIWIAGGIGITPFLSMAKTIKKTGAYSITLYYCVHDESEAVYLKDLLSLEKSGIHTIPFYSNKDGRLNVKTIIDTSGPIFHKGIFICAPINMIQSLRKQFFAQGVSKYAIHSEEFSF